MEESDRYSGPERGQNRHERIGQAWEAQEEWTGADGYERIGRSSKDRETGCRRTDQRARGMGARGRNRPGTGG